MTPIVQLYPYTHVQIQAHACYGIMLPLFTNSEPMETNMLVAGLNMYGRWTNAGGELVCVCVCVCVCGHLFLTNADACSCMLKSWLSDKSLWMSSSSCKRFICVFSLIMRYGQTQLMTVQTSPENQMHRHFLYSWIERLHGTHTHYCHSFICFCDYHCCAIVLEKRKTA